MRAPKPQTTEEKLALFRACFTGLSHAYGTYDPRSGRIFQIKQPVTTEVFLRHLRGQQPYGVYLLTGDRTRAMVIDFDVPDISGPLDFIRRSKHYKLRTYLERSKSIDSWHVWMFFDPCEGVNAAKARLVARHLLEEIDRTGTEVFPKQDFLRNKAVYGNFVFAPLNGALVLQGRTVFVDPNNPNAAHADQWEVLRTIRRVDESVLDEIIEINDLGSRYPSTKTAKPARRLFPLPPCAQTMLADGVTDHQRVACFRIACQLKRAGLPFASSLAVLTDWALRNRPSQGKLVITNREIVSQATFAYENEYRACGCEDPAVAPFCEPGCSVKRLPFANRSQAPVTGQGEKP